MIIEILVMQKYNDLKGRPFLYKRHVSEEFAFNELSQLNPYKSIGLIGFPARFLKGES